MDKRPPCPRAPTKSAWSEEREEEKGRYRNNKTIQRLYRCLFGILRDLRDNGVCKLGITTQLYTDQVKTPSKLPQYIEEMIGPYVDIAAPSITTFPLSFPVVFPEEHEIEQLFKDVFPQSEPHHERYNNNQRDALQLYAHKVADRDFFITSDTGILKRQSVLAQNWDIHVKSLCGYTAEKTHQFLTGLL